MQRRQLLGFPLLLTAGVAVGTLGACGFQLRGSAAYKYAFESIFSGFLPSSSLGQEFKRTALGWGLKVIDTAANANQAQVVLRVLQEAREKVVVGSGVAGQVREFQLRVRLRFALYTTQGKMLIDETELLQQRDVSYSESAALAKEAEEQLFYRDMQTDIVQQLMRRLAAIQSL